MKAHVERFGVQLKEALDIASVASLTAHSDIRNILISGLGGSGIGGTIISELIATECPVPIISNKDYFIPGFVNEHSLVIISSYSGNTEETLNAISEALNKKAKIVCITSGGKIAEIARQHQLDIVTVPGGNPPRSCLGYSLVQLFKIISFHGLIRLDYASQLNKAIQLIEDKAVNIKTEAMQLAKTLSGKIPVIYSLGSTEGIAVRFRQQINENSKMLCWHNIIPEMNHNELVGWTTRNEDLAVVILRTSKDYVRNIKRLEVCLPIFEKYASSVTQLVAIGNSPIEQAIYLIHLTDWATCYIADIKEIDPIEVRIIDHLKTELARI